MGEEGGIILKALDCGNLLDAPIEGDDKLDSKVYIGLILGDIIYFLSFVIEVVVLYIGCERVGFGFELVRYSREGAFGNSK